ncbi:MAG: hypothetical protein COY80_00025, partial [Candidatus Pacebacteria bacterium CG_4_10_14_0_8_um_filter_42_14]
FVHQRSLIPEVIRENGITILILSQKKVSDEPISEDLSKNISDQANAIRQTGLHQNCFFIAQGACKEQGFTGRVSAPSGVDKFLVWKNHCINWHEVDEGQVVALDFTAAINIDCGMGNFDVLLIRAEDLVTLLEYLAELYGGEWSPIQSNAVSDKL